MSNLKTVWGLYHINDARTEGLSDFFDTYEQALNAVITYSPRYLYYILEQTYELEELESHEFGDDE